VHRHEVTLGDLEPALRVLPERSELDHVRVGHLVAHGPQQPHVADLVVDQRVHRLVDPGHRERRARLLREVVHEARTPPRHQLGERRAGDVVRLELEVVAAREAPVRREPLLGPADRGDAVAPAGRHEAPPREVVDDDHAGLRPAQRQRHGQRPPEVAVAAEHQSGRRPGHLKPV
jgi:hypothetical protein